MAKHVLHVIARSSHRWKFVIL